MGWQHSRAAFGKRTRVQIHKPLPCAWAGCGNAGALRSMHPRPPPRHDLHATPLAMICHATPHQWPHHWPSSPRHTPQHGPASSGERLAEMKTLRGRGQPRRASSCGQLSAAQLSECFVVAACGLEGKLQPVLTSAVQMHPQRISGTASTAPAWPGRPARRPWSGRRTQMAAGAGWAAARAASRCSRVGGAGGGRGGGGWLTGAVGWQGGGGWHQAGGPGLVARVT